MFVRMSPLAGVMLKLAVFVALVLTCCVLRGGEDSDSSGLVAAFMYSLVVACLAAFIAFALVLPIDVVWRSAEYKRLGKGRSFHVIAFIKALRLIDFTSCESLEFCMQRGLLLAPRVAVPLAVYGTLRGAGPTSIPVVLISGVIAGLAAALFAFPFLKGEIDQTVAMGHAPDLLKSLQTNFTPQGLTILISGFLSRFPHTVIFYALLFTLLEITSNVLADKHPIYVFAGPAVAVLGATILASPLDQLRIIMVSHPLNLNEFLYAEEDTCSQSLKLNPDWKLLISHTKFVFTKWGEKGLLRLFGRIHLSTTSLALGLALLMQHAVLADNNSR